MVQILSENFGWDFGPTVPYLHFYFEKLFLWDRGLESKGSVQQYPGGTFPVLSCAV